MRENAIALWARWSITGNNNQKWIFRVDKTIESVEYAGQVIDIYGRETRQGYAVIAKRREGVASQRWTILAAGAGMPFVDIQYMCSNPFLLKTKMDTGFVITGSSTPSTNAVMQPVSAGNLDQYWCYDSTNKFIIAFKTGFILDIFCTIASKGFNVNVEREYRYVDDERWVFNADQTISSVINSDRLLDVYGGSSKPGTKVIVWSKNGGNNQKWEKVSVAPPTIAYPAAPLVPCIGKPTWAKLGLKNGHDKIKPVQP